MRLAKTHIHTLGKQTVYDSFSLLLYVLRTLLFMLYPRPLSCFLVGPPQPSRVTMQVAKRDLSHYTFFYGNLIIIV